jgi:response regulator RpfG family c-di-GMP phosphodiesterase
MKEEQNLTMQSRYDYKKYAILYVDDEEKSLKYFTRAFEDQFRIFTAPSAQEGYKVLEAHPDDIALIMTDQRMPGEKGVWLLEKARQLRPRTIRILATAYGMDADSGREYRRHLQIRHQAVGPTATGEYAQTWPGVFHGPDGAGSIAARENVCAA